MSREEIESKIDSLKTKRFLLNMKDHWTPEDYHKDDTLRTEIVYLERQLNE